MEAPFARRNSGSQAKRAEEDEQECEDYYDLRKTLPRFYRLFEHLNKGIRPSTSIMANALEVSEKMCSKDALERVVDGFMCLDGTFSVELEGGRVVLRRRLLSLQVRFKGMRLFRSHAPAVDVDQGSRLAYGPTTPEIMERFPARVAGVDLARKYLLALLPFSEKEVSDQKTMVITCPEKPREVGEQIAGLPGLKSYVEFYDIVAEIQATASSSVFAALGLPMGNCFRGRGVIWGWRHCGLSSFGQRFAPLEQLLSGSLSGSEFLWFSIGVLQGLSYEGLWLQRPVCREGPMLLLLRPRQKGSRASVLPLGAWGEAAQPEVLEVGECGPEDMPLLLQLVPRASGEEAELRAREAEETLGTGACRVMGSLMTSDDSQAGHLSVLQMAIPFLKLSSRFSPGSDRIHALGDMVRRGYEGCRLNSLLQTEPHLRLPCAAWMESWTLAAQEVPGWLQHFLGVAGPLSLMKMRDRHIERELVTAKSTGVVPDLFSMLDIKRAMQALKANDPMPKNLCCLIAGGIMSFEVTPTEELLASLESLKRLVAALRAQDTYRTRPWHCMGYLSHGSFSSGSVLVGSAGQMCLAGFGLGAIPSTNPLADTLQLSCRLLLEDCPLPVAHDDLYSLMVECGADVTTVADWLRIDEETARLILYMSKEEVAQRPESSKGPPQACVAQLRSAGPWPGAAVLGSRVHAREGQLEAQAMSTALLGLFPGSLVPDAGPTAELLEDLVAARGRPTEHRVRAIAALARPQLSEPRRWAWDLQVAVLEAIEDRMEAEAFQFASDHDPSLRSEYEAVCALSTALLLPHLAAALDLVFSQAFPPWQCLWALRHAVAASTRLVALLQAYLETKRQSLKSALSVLVPEGSRRPSGDLSWSFQKVQDTHAADASIAAMNLGGVYFDLKHCLLVRLTYRKGDADDELIKPRTPQTARLKLKSQDKPRRTSRLEPESAGTHRRPQSGLGRQTSRSSRISTSSAIESKAESIQLSYANPGGEHGFTDPLPGMITEELVPGASSTGMAVLQGKAFPLYGWPCPCFEGPDKKEKEQLEPYVVETHDADVEDQDGKPAQHKPVSMRAAPLWLGTLPDHVPSYILRRTVAPQLQGVMDKTHFYRGNILELSHGSAYFMGPMGVTVAQTAAVQKQAAEFKLKIGIASVKGHAALVRVKESVEINKSNDLTKLLDSEDWVRVHLRMSWSFESNNKDGVYVGGDGPVKAFQELRKVAGWIDGGRAFVLPAFLIYEAHRVEAWVSPFFTSPVQTDVDPTASLKVVTKIVLTDFENLIRGDASRNVATVDVTLFFRCSEEVRIFPRGARLRLLSQEDVVFEERKDHLEKADPPRRVDSHLSDASFGKQETPDERKPRDRRVLPQHTATILDLSRARPGMYDIQLDGVKRTAFFDPRPGNYKLAGVFRYAQSQQLVIFAGEWMDAEVLSVSVGNLHELRIEDPSGQKRKQKVSLNELNHSPAKLKLALYDACAQRFNQDLWMRHSHIPDALSTRWIDVLALTFAVLPVASAEESAEDSESADDGSSSSAEASDSDLEGVKDESLEGHEQAWQKLLQDIAPLSSKVREAGAVQGRTVLVWGKPATGKSTLLHRLLLESLVTSGGGVVPLVLEAKEIVRVICPPGGYCAEGDVLDVLLQTRFEQNKASYKLLWQALYSRRVIIFVDGADENDAKSWEYLTHYLNLLSSIGHLIVLFARPLQNNLRWHVKSHLQPSSVYRLGLFSVPLQRLAACARLGAFSADDFQHTFQHCEAMRRQPAGQALLVSQAELRDSGRLVSSGQEEPCTHLLGQMAETAVPHLISLNLSACLPENAMAWVLQLLEVMAMKLYIDSAQLLLPETMTQVVEAEHAELEGSWSFVRALIQSKQFVLVEPCLPPFDKEKVSRSYMRFVPLVLRDYFLARCFTRYLREKRILGLPRPEDIMFATEWDLFFDLMIEMAAANKVMVSIDLSSKKGMTEEQFASFTRRLANLKTPVIQLDMPPNQVNLPPELERLMVAAQKSVNHLGLGCNALAEKGAALLSSLLLDCEVTFLQLRNCLLGPDGTNALVQAFLRETRRRPSLKHAATTKLTLPGEAKLTLPGQELEAEQPSPPPSAGFKVSILDLSGNGLGSEGVQALVPVLEMRERDGGVLERLCLDENGLGPQGAMVLAKGLKKNSVLRGLSLSRNRLMDDGLEALAQALPGACGRRLRRLVLSSNELTALAGQCLAESLTGKACAHLERLDLANNPLEAEGVRFLSELLQKGLPNLKELDLEYTYAGSDGAGHLADAIMAGIPLRRLELCGCRVGAEGAGKLAAALRHPQGCRLTRLGLRGNAIEDEGVTKIANGLLEVGLRCFEFERSQRASSNRSSFASNGPGTSASRRSTADKTPAFLTQLQELDVANNRIGLFGADALAAVLTGAAKTRLTSLDVSRNCLGRQGVAALAAGLDEGCPLQHLNVGSAKMGDGGAEAMAKALQKGPKSMVWLQIQENRIGQRGLELLIEAIPKVPSLQRLAAGGNLAPDDWPDYLLNNLVCANRAGVTKPSVQLLSPSGRRWLGFRSVQRNASFGTMDPRFATVLQLEQAKDGSRRVRRTSVLKQSAS